MPASFLCVQFRNLLPSEELLLFARARWNEAQARGEISSLAGDATLSITQTASKLAPFEVELTVAEASLRSISRDIDPIAAVEEAFAQLGPIRELAMLQVQGAFDETASGAGLLSDPDTVLA
ncbi:MAG: hypothetical protein RLZZ450_7313 [Pseudomonadota bacterium]|jgi:hypothetical protein